MSHAYLPQEIEKYKWVKFENNKRIKEHFM
jgi:hypothetical protein